MAARCAASRKTRATTICNCRTRSGALHFFSKTQIAEETHEPKSLMPPVQAIRGGNARSARFPQPPRRRTTRSSADCQPRPAGGGIPFSEIVDPKPGDWPTYHGHLSGNRHSPLARDQHRERGAPRAEMDVPDRERQATCEVTPVVVDGVMYVTTANEVLRARCARAAARSGIIRRPLTKGVIGDAASAINRGVAVLGDKRVHGHRQCPHDRAEPAQRRSCCGTPRWPTSRQHYGATSAPLVVKDLVLSGTSGGDEGARGFRRRLSASHRRARLALLDHAGSGRARLGNLGRPRDRAWLRARRGSPALTIRRRT